MKHVRLLVLVPLLLAMLPSDARAQVSPLRLTVNKTQKDKRETTYQSTNGRHRTQEVNSTVFYTVEVANIAPATLSNLKINWAILIDPSHGEHLGGGVGWNEAHLKVATGERACNIGLGLKYKFDTDPVDLSAVVVDNNGQHHTRGGSVRGYMVEVYQGGHLIASDYSPSDIKNQIDHVRENRANKGP